jgi:hypothetical protein
MDEEFCGTTLQSVHHKIVSKVMKTVCKSPEMLSRVPKPLPNLVSVPVMFTNGKCTSCNIY